MAKVLHLSDLHFGADKSNVVSNKDLLKYLNQLFRILGPETIIIISGDITFKGTSAGYDLAQQFFEDFIETADVRRGNFVICPGNHDIMPGRSFVGFDRFSYAVRRDSKCTFQGKSGVRFQVGSVDFLVMNSAHHEDPNYGDIDIEVANSLLEDTLPVDCDRMAVTHHHVIPTFRDDRSAICNAYEFLQLLDNHGYPALVHGHQHFTTSLAVGGTPTSVFGVGSSNFSAKGIGNGLHVYTIEGGKFRADRYTLVVDAASPDIPGYVKSWQSSG